MPRSVLGVDEAGIDVGAARVDDLRPDGETFAPIA
jgi:hypothetical protein